MSYLLLQKLMLHAKKYGYKQCYLETLHRMEQANKLYNQLGFVKLPKTLGNTGHFGCDTWCVKKL